MTTFKGIDLTDEQDFTVDCIKTGEDSKVQAPAGSGKTFTLEAAAYVMQERRGLYLAFNKAIAESAKTKFSNNVDCRTGHSVAFGQVAWPYKDRISKLTGTLIAKQMFIGDTGIYNTPAAKGYIILDTIRRFCFSADKEIQLKHVPVITGPYLPEHIPAMREDIVPYAKDVWADQINVDGNLPITHDTYVKLWHLSDPHIKKDFILFDEAQDANPVMLDIIMQQEHCQKIFVGDKFQQIYGWRGAINAMDKINTKHSTYITQSFRFGDAIADMANRVLQGYMPPELAPPSIKGLKTKDGEVLYTPIDDPDVVICRTNSGVISNVFKYLEKDVKIYVQGGVAQMLTMLRGTADLQMGKRTYAPDLALFNNWEEVIECSGTESGQELRSFVKMVQDHGVPALTDALKKTMPFAGSADLTLTTAHKAKGLEWERVQLHSDFPTPAEDKSLEQSEINLLYVALTRALTTLDASKCPSLHPETIYNAQASFGGHSKKGGFRGYIREIEGDQDHSDMDYDNHNDGWRK